MPTQARVVYDGAICHIMQRGNNKQTLFKEPVDYKKFLSLIAKYKDKYAFEMYNYCLMPNHIHILMMIRHGKDLSRLMQGILQSFRHHYKRKYGYVGYLYQGRYKSKLIRRDAYLMDCSRYIERNPLRAKIVNDVSQYIWSSYHFYACGNRDDLITENPMFSLFGSDSASKRKAYCEYILTSRAYEEIIDKEFDIV